MHSLNINSNESIHMLKFKSVHKHCSRLNTVVHIPCQINFLLYNLPLHFVHIKKKTTSILMSFYVFLYLPCKMLWDPHIKCFVWVRFQPGGQILYSILACISGHPYQPTISLPCCCSLQGAMSCGHVWHLPKGQELPADTNKSARSSLPTGSAGGCCVGRIQQNCAVRPTSSYNFS